MAGNACVMVDGKVFPEQKNPQSVRLSEIPFTATRSNEKEFAQPGNGDDLKGNVRFKDLEFLRLDCLCGFLRYGN